MVRPEARCFLGDKKKAAVLKAGDKAAAASCFNWKCPFFSNHSVSFKDHKQIKSSRYYV